MMEKLDLKLLQYQFKSPELRGKKFKQKIKLKLKKKEKSWQITKVTNPIQNDNLKKN